MLPYSSATHLVQRDDLTVRLLDLAELAEEVPEPRLGDNVVGRKNTHTVDLGGRVGLAGEVAADDLVFLEASCASQFCVQAVTIEASNQIQQLQSKVRQSGRVVRRQQASCCPSSTSVIVFVVWVQRASFVLSAYSPLSPGPSPKAHLPPVHLIHIRVSSQAPSASSTLTCGCCVCVRLVAQGSSEISFGCNCWTVASVEEKFLLTHLDNVSTCNSTSDSGNNSLRICCDVSTRGSCRFSVFLEATLERLCVFKRATFPN